jgi:hypothetical protein
MAEHESYELFMTNGEYDLDEDEDDAMESEESDEGETLGNLADKADGASCGSESPPESENEKVADEDEGDARVHALCISPLSLSRVAICAIIFHMSQA